MSIHLPAFLWCWDFWVALIDLLGLAILMSQDVGDHPSWVVAFCSLAFPVAVATRVAAKKRTVAILTGAIWR